MILELPPHEPAEQNPVWDYEIDLPKDDGTYNATFRFFIQWCERTASWYLSLFDANGNLTVGRMRLVVNWKLGQNYTGRIPTGGFLSLLDLEGEGAEATYESFGHRHRLTWATLDELPAEAADIPYTITKNP
jgi:hypothetical protein